MKKSITGNLIFGGFALVIIIFACIMLYGTSYVETFAINQKSAELLKNVNYVEQTTYLALVNKSVAMDAFLQNSIASVGEVTESSVVVFDVNGIIFASSDTERSDNSFSAVSKKVSTPVLRGEQIVSMNVYKDQFGDKILTVGAPLMYKNEIFGGVMFNQRVPEIKSVYAFFINRIFNILIVCMILSALLYGYLSFRITSPIRHISAAVKEFSKGNFKKRVNYNSENELGELATNINEMANSLENLENLRRGFISDVSHELRTPLTTISGFVEGIIDGTIPEENQNEYLDVVLSETKRMSRLITNLLQLSRMESGESKLERSDFDINELVRLTLLKFEMMITPKDIDVELNITEGRLMVNADKDNISQVLINLINNAVKFTPDGGNIKIDVVEERDRVYVSVENTGHGIEEEDLHRIWDRFYKADKSRGMDRTGMGLGLYIVKRIISMHGENICVNSIPDKYTRFTFSLLKSRVSEVKRLEQF